MSVLEACLVAAGLVEPAWRWEALGGGRSNRIWRIGRGRGALICKLYRPGAANRLFPNDSAAEYRVLRHLRGSALAPAPVARLHTPLGPCVVYRHVPGRTWRSGAARVGRLLGRLHALPPPDGLRRIASGEVALRRQALALLRGAQVPRAARDRVRALMPAPAGIGPAAPVFLHGDAVPGNVIVPGGIPGEGTPGAGAVLIDWQCPAIGDPCEDLAVFLSPAMQALYGAGPLPGPERRAFLDAYGDAATVARLSALMPWFHWRMAAYCLWQAGRGASAYADALELELAALTRPAAAATAG